MRAVLLLAVAAPLLAIGVLSIRPGGLRQQLRNVRRRFRIFMILAGIYMLASLVARIVLGDTAEAENVLLGLLAVELAIFVILAQDPRPARP